MIINQLNWVILHNIFFCPVIQVVIVVPGYQENMEFPKESLPPHEINIVPNPCFGIGCIHFGGHYWGDISYFPDRIHGGKSKNEPHPHDSKLGI
jgi:hypothetical protein